MVATGENGYIYIGDLVNMELLFSMLQPFIRKSWTSLFFLPGFTTAKLTWLETKLPSLKHTKKVYCMFSPQFSQFYWSLISIFSRAWQFLNVLKIIFYQRLPRHTCGVGLCSQSCFYGTCMSRNAKRRDRIPLFSSVPYFNPQGEKGGLACSFMFDVL